jgi:hypothetical protein
MAINRPGWFSWENKAAISTVRTIMDVKVRKNDNIQPTLERTLSTETIRTADAQIIKKENANRRELAIGFPDYSLKTNPRINPDLISGMYNPDLL